MTQIFRPLRIPFLVFAAVVLGVYGTAWFVVSQISRLESAGAVVAGLTCDIVLVVPLAYYFLVVRRAGHSIVRVLPVLVASLILATAIIPSGHHQTLDVLETIVVPVELGFLGWIIWQASRSLRKARSLAERDPVELYRVAALEMVGNRRAAGILATEISMIHFGLGSWRQREHSTSGASVYTYHRRSGMAGLVLGLVFMLVVEGLAVHLLLARWSGPAAWLFTLSSLYGALWLLADYRASVLRPILVDGDRVLVRAGIRFTGEIPRAKISRVHREKPGFGREALNIKLLGAPSHWIILAEPVELQGPYGITKRVRALGLELDDPEG